jgi:uncharacterized OsmC-like protein
VPVAGGDRGCNLVSYYNENTTMEKVTTVINGVDIKRLSDTIEAVKNNPALAAFRFRLNNEWIRGGHNQSVIKGFFGNGEEDSSRVESYIYASDEPEVLLGQDNAANPVEFVLHALAGCLTTSIIYHASARGYKLDKLTTSLEGDMDIRGFLDMDNEVRNGYKNIRVSVCLEGADLTEEEKEDILRFGPMFSPVYDIITNRVPVEVSFLAAPAENSASAARNTGTSF